MLRRPAYAYLGNRSSVHLHGVSWEYVVDEQLKKKMPTSREEARSAVCQVLSKIPSIAKSVIELDELDPIAASKSQLIFSACIEVI